MGAVAVLPSNDVEGGVESAADVHFLFEKKINNEKSR